MTYKTARSDILDYLEANYTTTAISWENSPTGEPALPYIQVDILDAPAVDLSLQYQSIQYPGIVSINVWQKQGAGTITTNEIADELLTIFTFKDIGTVETKAPYKTVVGEVNGRYQITVTIPFERRT